VSKSSPLVSTTRFSRSESHASAATGSQYDPATSPAISERPLPWTTIPYFTSFATHVKRTPEDVATERMNIMLGRENHMRERDTALIRAQEAVATLELGHSQAQDDDVPTAPLNPWSSQYAIQDKLRRDCVKWILDVCASIVAYRYLSISDRPSRSSLGAPRCPQTRSFNMDTIPCCSTL
jgi:hypothetical protein